MVFHFFLNLFKSRVYRSNMMDKSWYYAQILGTITHKGSTLKGLRAQKILALQGHVLVKYIPEA